MSRYNITLTADNGETKPVNKTIWADSDKEAIDRAHTLLVTIRTVRRDATGLDTFEVWQGVPPYMPHKTVAKGGLRAHRHPDQPR